MNRQAHQKLNWDLSIQRDCPRYSVAVWCLDPGDPRYSVAVWLWWTVGILTLLEAQRGDTADGGVPPLHEAVKIE